jgi:hypothetical protein
VLMNLLPGLRELRAPLASGYLWLLSAWLFLGQMDWLPSKRPPGSGEVARLWDLGGTLGKTVALAAVTFVAYLIGSFLEMNPDGRIATSLTSLVLADRRPWYLRRAYLKSPERFALYVKIEESLLLEGIGFGDSQARSVAQSISLEARRDLIAPLKQRNMLPPKIDHLEPLSGPSSPEASAAEEHLLKKEIAADHIIAQIVQEMQQLASRLLVKNQDLYGKYDRQMAEASVRMNVSIPLTVLLVLASWLSGFPIWLRIGPTVVALAFGFMLLRQGFLRAVSARDVIVQALVIGEVESRYLPEEKVTVQVSAGVGSQGWPWYRPRRTASGFRPCLRAVDR